MSIMEFFSLSNFNIVSWVLLLLWSQTSFTQSMKLRYTFVFFCFCEFLFLKNIMHFSVTKWDLNPCNVGITISRWALYHFYKFLFVLIIFHLRMYYVPKENSRENIDANQKLHLQGNYKDIMRFWRGDKREDIVKEKLQRIFLICFSLSLSIF